MEEIRGKSYQKELEEVNEDRQPEPVRSLSGAPSTSITSHL